jgi:hypothetical protein
MSNKDQDLLKENEGEERYSKIPIKRITIIVNK